MSHCCTRACVPGPHAPPLLSQAPGQAAVSGLLVSPCSSHHHANEAAHVLVSQDAIIAQFSRFFTFFHGCSTSFKRLTIRFFTLIMMFMTPGPPNSLQLYLLVSSLNSSSSSWDVTKSRISHSRPITTLSWVSKAGKLRSYVFHIPGQPVLQTCFRCCQPDRLTW